MVKCKKKRKKRNRTHSISYQKQNLLNLSNMAKNVCQLLKTCVPISQKKTFSNSENSNVGNLKTVRTF